MKKSSTPYEKIYIHLTGFKTKEDGIILILLAIDDFSKFAFEPVTLKQDNLDVEFEKAIVKIFKNILKDYKPAKHPDNINFITNLPQSLEPVIMKILKEKHTVICDSPDTLKAVKPILDKMPMFSN